MSKAFNQAVEIITDPVPEDALEQLLALREDIDPDEAGMFGDLMEAARASAGGIKGRTPVDS